MNAARVSGFRNRWCRSWQAPLSATWRDGTKRKVELEGNDDRPVIRGKALGKMTNRW